MTRRGIAIVTDVTITALPTVPLLALEIWAAPDAVAQRFLTATGFALPAMGRSAGGDTLRLIRYEPTVWLVEGDAGQLPAIVGDDGALTAIGGGLQVVRLSGPGWRLLLMEGGVFDAENPHFGPGSSASTIIDHIAVRLHVVSDDICDAYVPRSFSANLLHFWQQQLAVLV